MKPIDWYREQIQQLPHPDEGWFVAALAAYRARQDDDSLRELCGLSVHQTLAEAEEFCGHRGAVDLLDAIQEANVAAVEAVKTFRGPSLAEFQAYLHRMVQTRLYSLFPAI